MDKLLYGYWFKSKKKTFGWGWTIVPTAPQGYIIWAIAFISCVLLLSPELLSVFSKEEVMIISGTVLATATLIMFIKTDLREDP